MKWGVRRYQNKDGTRTPLGRRRERKKAKDDRPTYNLSPKQVKKNMNYMTDQELQRALNRLNMQQQVNRMNPSIIDRGHSKVQKYAAVVGGISTAIIATNKLVKLLSKAMH